MSKNTDALNKILTFALAQKSKQYSREERIAELLKRNKEFGEGLEKNIRQRGKKAWRSYVGIWHVDFGWDGDLLKLHQHIQHPSTIDHEAGMDFLRGALEAAIYDFYLNFEDVTAAWKDVRSKQDSGSDGETTRDVAGRKGVQRKCSDERPNFGRDLCWYDLNQIIGMPPTEIAGLWYEKFPRDVAVMLIKHSRRVKDVTDDLKKLVIGTDEADIIDKIVRGEVTGDLENAINIFVGGRASNRDTTEGLAPLADIIRQATRELAKDIANVGKPSPLLFKDYGLPT